MSRTDIVLFYFLYFIERFNTFGCLVLIIQKFDLHSAFHHSLIHIFKLSLLIQTLSYN